MNQDRDGLKKQVSYGREHEDMREKILEGLALTPLARHELALSLSLHVLDVLKAQGMEPLEEVSAIPRSTSIIELPRRRKK